ncbi:hypothetical protein GOD95_07470 [Paeniclostridium sordellii]|uniref:UPF0489 family protein n=1 Tax=Paraclostridium sordellii TaxID=1505 RepID=UPI0012ED7434|nr:UPF0489 family protein [Paeniclostridium sordellii]MDU2688834.1 UPF0489 family protein [Paeniclostridium sordellii]MDU6249540.1 UPF0489 family protein [Paeniclostridium sordellii]MVO71287.1 hypothetical protein [Paeniclostridium sordellii]
MNRYTGFYIDKPLGNNVFSYDERENKKIYVPKLIQGDLNDVKIGHEVVFSEIEFEEEINSIGLKNIVKFNYKDKTVYIFDNHNYSFYFWIKSLKEGLFNKGCKLVHIDQHKDMREPENYVVDIENLDDVFRYTNYVLNVGNFIKPALYHNIFSDVIIIDSTYGFEIDIDGEIVLDIDLDIFSKDMEYMSYDLRINKIREYINRANVITIASSPFFIDQGDAIKVLKELFNCDII